jgi:hypothetical protein
VDNNKILKEVRNYTGPKKDIRIYLDVGSVSQGLERVSNLGTTKWWRCF